MFIFVPLVVKYLLSLDQSNAPPSPSLVETSSVGDGGGDINASSAGNDPSSSPGVAASEKGGEQHPSTALGHSGSAFTSFGSGGGGFSHSLHHPHPHPPVASSSATTVNGSSLYDALQLNNSTGNKVADSPTYFVNVFKTKSPPQISLRPAGADDDDAIVSVHQPSSSSSGSAVAGRASASHDGAHCGGGTKSPAASAAEEHHFVGTAATNFGWGRSLNMKQHQEPEQQHGHAGEQHRNFPVPLS